MTCHNQRQVEKIQREEEEERRSTGWLVPVCRDRVFLVFSRHIEKKKRNPTSQP